MSKIYMFDIDNTICLTHENDYYNSIPILSIIKKINELFDAGNTIKIATSRGSKSGINWRDFTIQQLKKWKVKYHELITDKPDYDVFIDDKAINSNDFYRLFKMT